MTTVAIVIPYFNPAGYRSHRPKLDRCLAALREQGLIEDVFLTTAGDRPPPGVNVAFQDPQCPYAWHKERLLNLAVRHLPAKYTHVVWLDNDVMVGPGWLHAVRAAFEKAPVVQAFRTARYWADDKHAFTRPSVLLPGENRAAGLAWGASRSLFHPGPGLFELGLVGGGDTLLAAAVLAPTAARSTVEPLYGQHGPKLIRPWPPVLRAAYTTWCTDIARWLGDIAPVAADTGIDILMHGSMQDRRYLTRDTALALLDPGEHLRIEDDRVFDWTASGRSSIESGVRAYFLARHEDDPA